MPIQQTIEYVKQQLDNAEGGHDWWHIERVWKTSKQIAQSEDVDMLIVELGALLHDIADSKFHDGDEEIGPRRAADFMRSLQLDDSIIEHVVQIIRNISFKGGKEAQTFKSHELDVVQDADRLDALGAIGIARTFNYGGFKNRAIYDPTIPPNLHMTKEEYKKSTAPSINHFYEKLLLLKDRMNTPTGKAMADKRHQYMEDYLSQFYNEWEGKL
ncbi:MAG: HD domain-containing protein [Bacteroidia bacterium]